MIQGEYFEPGGAVDSPTFPGFALEVREIFD
jgi:Uma2 family endonuclease